MATIIESDVQGFVLSPYHKTMTQAAYALLTITEPNYAREWLETLVENISSGNDIAAEKTNTPRQNYLNVAFTYAGLQKLLADKYDLPGFSREFREGMAARSPSGDPILRRSSMLGDVGASDPENWQWGGFNNNASTVHMLLMLFVPAKTEFNEAIDAMVAMDKVLGGSNDLSEHGLKKSTETLTAYLRSDNKEHFGFKDGISQPVIEGTSLARRLSIARRFSEASSRTSLIKAGEFIFGYKNEQNLFPVSPRAIAKSDGVDVPTPPRQKFDLGRHGSYLVFRQLEQNVKAFEDYLNAQTVIQRGKVDDDWKDWLAAKMIGRWKNGAPLVRYPERATGSIEHGKFDTENRTHLNDFYFDSEDRDGLRCPIGAHIRRANPRDSLGPEPREALRLSKRHRLLRRGRIYGPTYNPDQIGNDEKRGLMFICLNADIAGQFEAVQHSWINNPQFAGLYDERDPLLGERTKGDRSMTIQRRPANERLEGMKEFVTVRGGAYFFMPGMAALRGLAGAR